MDLLPAPLLLTRILTLRAGCTRVGDAVKALTYTRYGEGRYEESPSLTLSSMLI